jgi:acyl-coenzyme A thioesterase PaaI-like protein
VDATVLARRLLEPIPANRTAGIEVLYAADETGRVAVTTPESMTNVIGSLHASGLVALQDAAGLAAVIGAGTVVCQGAFRWSIRRQPTAATCPQ